MGQPENTFILLLAAALMAQLLSTAPLRLDHILSWPEAHAEVPAALLHPTAQPQPKPAPLPKLVRDKDDHFNGAS